MSDRYTPAEALDLLVDGFDEELDGWSAIVADASAEPARKRGARGMPSLRRATRIRLGLLAAGVAAAAALIVTSPWKTTGPAGISDAQAAQILRNVQAATAPQPGRILHVRQRTTYVMTPTRKSGRVSQRLSTERESWERSAPYRERALVSYQSQTLETGVTVKGCYGYPALFDLATNTIYHYVRLRMPSCVQTGAGFSHRDLAGFFRHDLAAGLVKVVARTRLNGEDVYRLEPSSHNEDHGLVFYVDARSYRLVRWVMRWEASRATSARGYSSVRFILEYRTWEYLPSTAANLALTDIRRQHPGARISTFSHLPQGATRRLISEIEKMDRTGMGT